jgi:hypothetical protein
MAISPSELRTVFAADADKIITREPFPNSRKIYVEGTLPGVRVAMREVTQSRDAAGKNNLTAEDEPGDHPL